MSGKCKQQANALNSLLKLLFVSLILCFVQVKQAEATAAKRMNQPEEQASVSAPHRTTSSGSIVATPRQRIGEKVAAETIVLENGSTTFITSLEDFLASEAPPRVNELLEREGEARQQNFTQFPTANSGNRSTWTSPNEDEQKSSKLAIVFGNGGQIYNNTRSATGDNTTKHEKTQAETKNNATTSKPIPQHWQVKGLLNFTHDYPLAYSQIINGYVWPLMAAITSFTNLMIVFVLTQRDMRTPTNIVLTAIAIADIVPIVVPVPWFVYLFAMGNEKQVLYPPIACYFYQHSTRSVSEIFYFLSTWLNVLLAIQDYLSACWPKLAKKYCQIKVVIWEIMLLTLFAFLLNLPQAVKLVYKPVKFYYQNQLTWGCKALQAKWFKDLVGEHVALYDDIFTSIIVLFVDGGPSVLLITLTALLIKQLQKQRIKGHQLMEQARTASKRRRERHRQLEYESSARVMIFVLLAFLAVKIPFATTYTLMIIQSRFDIHFVENLVDFQKAITLTDLVFVLSYPINFTIFCCCSKKFRHKCAQLFGECNNSTKLTRDRLMSSLSGSLNTIDGSFMSSIRRRLSRTNDSSRASSISVSNSLAKQQRQIDRERHNEGLGSILEERRRESAMKLTAAQHCEEVASLLRQANDKNADTENDAHDQYRCQEHQEQEAREKARKAQEGQNQVASLLEEGSLCVECILRYEQLRGSISSAGSLASRSQTSKQQQQQYRAAQLQSWSAGMPVAQPGFFQQNYFGSAYHNRRASQMSDTSSGNSWPSQPFPSPASSCGAFQQQQQQARAHLPQIITTTYESIREQQSQEEATSTSGRQQTANNLAVNDPEATDNNSSWSASQWSGTISQMAHDDHHEHRDDCDQDVNQNQNQQQENEKEAQDDAQQLEQNSRQSNGCYQRFCSDPGAYGINISNESFAISDLCKEVRRRQIETRARSFATPNEEASMGADRDKSDSRWLKHPKKRHFYARTGALQKPLGRQRSLSLSNSNLSTLPNATGLLADILVGTLLGSAEQSAVESESKNENRKKKRGKNR